MFVLEIIPFSRTAPATPLSYRSRAELAPGTLVSIPLRKRQVLGLVLSSRSVQEAKYELKNASFSLSKSSSATVGNIPACFISAAESAASYHATTLGATLSTLLVPVLPTDFPSSFTQKKLTDDTFAELTERLEAPLLTRREAYAEHIQHISVQKGTSQTVLLVVPTQVEADDWADYLKGYKPIVLSGKVTGKKRETALNKATSETDPPRLVISTPSFSWVPLPYLSRVLIDRVSAGGYQLPKRPYLDTRIALTELARARGVPLTYGDYPLPLEYRTKPAGKLAESIVQDILVLDTRAPKTDVKKETSAWQAVSEPLRAIIKKTTDAGGRVAILATRKGYSPTVVCRDCGTAVADEHGRILSLATHKGVRVYRANDGTMSSTAEVFCKVCGGWNLSPLGIGVERIEEELHAAFPDATLVRIDQDTKASASLKKVREEISAPGTIIIGTELMLSYLSVSERVEVGIIASADSLLALPFWRARERFVRISYMLAERSQKTVIATRHPEDAALSALSKSTSHSSTIETDNVSFWKEETELRKILLYPPFGTLIVFHIEASGDAEMAKARLEEARAQVRNACLPYIPHETSEQKALSQGRSVLKSSLVLQLPKGVWPDIELSTRLASLSPAIRINVDSEMLW